jgi:hypothetical protein
MAPRSVVGKVSTTAVLVAGASVLRVVRGARERPGITIAAIGLPVAVGLADVLGTAFYVRGAEVAVLAIVTASRPRTRSSRCSAESRCVTETRLCAQPVAVPLDDEVEGTCGIGLRR